MTQQRQGNEDSTISSGRSPRQSTDDKMQGLLSAVVSIAEDPNLDAVLMHIVQAACKFVSAQ